MSQTEQTARKKDDFLKAFAVSDNISQAAKKAEIARCMVYEWIGTDPMFKVQFKELREVELDFAETQLRELRKNGNLGAIIFYLKCHGKHRGWIETSRQEITGEGGGPVLHEYDIGKRLAQAIERTENAIRTSKSG